jgi:hypothetical protein
VLCFCTRKWFTSLPCLREFVRAILRKRKLIALLEPFTSSVHGGHTEAECRAIIASPEWEERWQRMAESVATWAHEWKQPGLKLPTAHETTDALFTFAPIIWSRLADFQDVSMRQIGERLIHAALGDALTLRSPMHNSVLDQRACEHRYGEEYQQVAYMANELGSRIHADEIEPPLSDGCTFTLYCSAANPGAEELGEELHALCESVTFTTDPRQLDACSHFLVRLNEKTWTRGEASFAFAKEVACAMCLGVHCLLMHEVLGARWGDNEWRDACAFEHFFMDNSTPKALIKAGLYNEIAMNVAGDELRMVGLLKTIEQLAKGSEARKPLGDELLAVLEGELGPIQEEEFSSSSARQRASATTAATWVRQGFDMATNALRVPVLRNGTSFRQSKSSTKRTTRYSASSRNKAHSKKVLPASSLRSISRATALPPSAAAMRLLAQAPNEGTASAAGGSTNSFACPATADDEAMPEPSQLAEENSTPRPIWTASSPSGRLSAAAQEARRSKWVDVEEPFPTPEQPSFAEDEPESPSRFKKDRIAPDLENVLSTERMDMHSAEHLAAECMQWETEMAEWERDQEISARGENAQARRSSTRCIPTTPTRLGPVSSRSLSSGRLSRLAPEQPPGSPAPEKGSVAARISERKPPPLPTAESQAGGASAISLSAKDAKEAGSTSSSRVLFSKTSSGKHFQLESKDAGEERTALYRSKSRPHSGEAHQVTSDEQRAKMLKALGNDPLAGEGSAEGLVGAVVASASTAEPPSVASPNPTIQPSSPSGRLSRVAPELPEDQKRPSRTSLSKTVKKHPQVLFSKTSSGKHFQLESKDAGVERTALYRPQSRPLSAKAHQVTSNEQRAKMLKVLGDEASVLHDEGIAATDAKRAGYEADDLFRAGYSARELVDAGFAPMPPDGSLICARPTHTPTAVAEDTRQSPRAEHAGASTKVGSKLTAKPPPRMTSAPTTSEPRFH